MLSLPQGLSLQSLNVVLNFDESGTVTNVVYNVSVKNESGFGKATSGTLPLTEEQQTSTQTALVPVYDAILKDISV